MLASREQISQSCQRWLQLIFWCLSSAPLRAQEAAIPYKSTTADGPASQFLDVLLIIGVLMAVAALAVAFYRKRLVREGSIPAERGGHLQVLDRKVLSTRLTAHLISVEGRKILICDSGQGVAVKDLSGHKQREAGEA